MSSHRIAVTVLILACVAFVRCAESQDAVVQPVSVRPTHGWTNVFAGKSTRFDCQVTSQAAGTATLYWSVSVERAVIGRGERALNLEANRATDVSLDLDFPELKSGLVVPAAVSLEVRTQGGMRAQRTVALHVFSPDIAANRAQWLKSLEVSLFDPAGKTSAALEVSHIPYRITDGPHGSQTTNGLIIHGEGIEPARQSASWQAAVASAASGRRVIVMASSGGVIPLDGVFMANDGRPTAVSLRRSDVIRDLDKRLDCVEWPAPGRLVAASLHWSVKGGAPVVEIRDDTAGWPWLDVRYPNGGRLVWTGLGLIESWETTPAARYLFVKLLEDVMIEKPEAGGSKHAVQ